MILSLKFFLLGLIQGVSEFFPISSSTHLKIAQKLMGIEQNDQLIFMQLICHFGSLIAILIYFRQDIFTLLFRHQKLITIYFFALLPLPFFYVLFKMTKILNLADILPPFGLAMSGIILLSTRKKIVRNSCSITLEKRFRDCFSIGVMQSLALIPGLSRSALTLSTAHHLGWNEKDAVRFSFILSIPTVIGGNLIHSLALFSGSHSSLHLEPIPLLICLLSSMITSLVVIRIAIPLLEKGRYQPFGWYCLLLAVLTFVFFNI